MYKKYNVNANYFKYFTYDMSYILGFIYADGCIYKNNKNSKKLNISSQDKEILEKIKIKLNSNHKLYKSGNCYNLVISNKFIYDDLIKIGITERKSLTTKFPNIPNKYINSFIRGYFDGDGSIFLSKTDYPTISFVGTKPFLFGIVKHLGVNQYSINKKVNSPVYDLRYRGNTTKSIINKLYNDSGIHLSRKYNLCKKAMKWNGLESKKWSEEDISTLLNIWTLPQSRTNIRGKIASGILQRSERSIYSKISRLEG